jgi:hypothetical protein
MRLKSGPKRRHRVREITTGAHESRRASPIYNRFACRAAAVNADHDERLIDDPRADLHDSLSARARTPAD